MGSSASDASCVVCGSRDVDVCAAQPEDFEYFVKPAIEIRLLYCSTCGSRFLWPRPGASDLTSFYPLDYHAYHEDHGLVASILVRRRSRARARRLLRLAGRSPVRLFDVGTGDCRHFDDMSRHGSFEFAGIEIKPEIARKARERGYRVEEGTLEEMDVKPHEGRFDIVTMYQLAEHVIDPRGLFEKALALLRPGGFVVGQLPCVDSFERRLFGRYWAGYHYPRHLQAFSRRGLRELLEGSGFSEAAVESALHLQAGLSLQNLLVGRLGYRPRLRFGKTPIYSLFLLAAAPFCVLEHFCGRGGMMNFQARKTG